MGIQVRLNNVVLGYNSLFVARESEMYKNGKKYSATFLVEKGSENDKKIQAAMASLIAADAVDEDDFEDPAYYDGDTHKKLKKYESNHGRMVLRSSRTEAQGKPGTLDQVPQEVMDPSTFYSGCVVNADVDIYVGRKGGTRVCFCPVQVQFAADGERIGAREEITPFEAVAGAEDVPDFMK